VLYQKSKFTVPAAEPQKKTLCKIHHFVKGQCLRCPEKIVTKKPEESNGTA
jgi:hypothetical protein